MVDVARSATLLPEAFMRNHGIARSNPARLALLIALTTLPAQAFAQGIVPRTAPPTGGMMRPDVMGREAAVVSDHALASAAGAAVLKR
jgi:hypothetical protein